jgi:hypothetical protein
VRQVHDSSLCWADMLLLVVKDAVQLQPLLSLLVPAAALLCRLCVSCRLLICLRLPVLVRQHGDVDCAKLRASKLQHNAVMHPLLYLSHCCCPLVHALCKTVHICTPAHRCHSVGIGAISHVSCRPSYAIVSLQLCMYLLTQHGCNISPYCSMYRSRWAQQKARTLAALLWPAAGGPQWLSAQLPGTPLSWSWAEQAPSAAQKNEHRYDRTSAKVNSEGSAC